MDDDFVKRRKSQENLILLVLGAVSDTPMSKLHLEKDIYLLYNFHLEIPKFIKFSAYHRGPYSQEIADAIQDPYIRTDEWVYNPIDKQDKYSSGYIKLTEKGREEYKKLYDKMLSNKRMHSLLAGIELVRRLYDNLTPQEFIYIIYETYPNMTVNSEIKNEIFAKREEITRNLKQKFGFITDTQNDPKQKESLPQ